MGILDEAIREHLELKRQHGAEEKEIEGLEAEAFGPADRPDATEAETQIISPGSSVTAPAGEGDQLDKVFEATREAEAAAQEQAPSAETGGPAPIAEAPSTAAAAPATDEPALAEQRPSDAPESPAEPKAEADTAAEASVVEEASEDAAEVAPEPPSAEQPLPEQEGDAGDMLEAERHHLASHPTEHYDVDAAIAEEDEIDLLSESSLSDELDRALDGPSEPAAAEPDSALPAEDPITADPIEEPRSDRSEFEAPAEPQLPVEEDEELDEDGAEDPDEGSGADFFDQEDPLEGTPDFLEETPEHDRLWFEQKEPKDFDFGD